jgi:GNAT superfamily N-acetyltransferase
MADVRIEHLVAKDPALDQIETLLGEMYEYMEQHGLLLPLAPGGTRKLRRAIESSLGRSGTLLVARDADGIVGFTHGLLRLTPDYLGGGVVGLVNHTYVRAAFRGSGVGAKLIAALDEWFVSKNVSSIELVVLTGNTDAIRFWQARGFLPELLQMRRPRVEPR